jgi:DNA-binding NtrC family response regulator
MMPRLCLIEDDPIMGESLSDRFQLEGFELDWYTSGREAALALARRAYDVVVSDIRLPDLSGEQVFAEAQRLARPAPPFLFVTAHGSLARAVALLKQGAADYVTKPFDIAELVDKVRQAAGETAADPQADWAAGELGLSRAIRALEQQAPRIAARARTVLVTGESGSGKEVLARHLHALAHPGGGAPFVAVNCGAIPESLIEAELFGHERGAYTGADRARRGHFEQAIGGTLFLDEVAELAPALQVKLLRVLQDRRIRRLGGETEIDVDLRLVCATHRDLRALVAQGRFREDLYYRIHVVHLRVPPLRERPEDVLWLARRFLADLAREQGEDCRTLGVSARAALLAHAWPGNVRELHNRLERACVLTPHRELTAADLFDEDGEVGEVTEATDTLPTLEAFVAEAERSYLKAVLARHDGRVGLAAAALGISRKTLWEKCRRHGLRTLE